MERWRDVGGMSKNAKIIFIKAVDNIRVSLEANSVNMRAQAFGTGSID